MKKVAYSVLLALGSASVAANTISGKVTDQAGNIVTEGEVQIMGTQLRAPILDDGSFYLRNVNLGEVEIHIAAPRYVHESSIFNVSAQGLSDVTITVKDASIEVFDVRASSFHASTLESALPVSVLAGDRLNRQQRSSLGDTLASQVGVHSSAHGGVTSTPIIRGLSGPRVLVAQNGLDASDASRVGPDHLVSTETSTAQQVEVLRGPATLFYGSGAIGGVVNVVDQRIPSYADEKAEVAISRNTNNAEEAFNGSVVTTQNDFVFSASAFFREADEYKVPGMAELEDGHHEDEHHEDAHADEHEAHDDEHHDDEHEGSNRVENSDYRMQGISVGGSYLFDKGYVGLAFENQSSRYGIPGHAHGAHEEHEGEEHDEDAHSEESVKLDMNQSRYQLAGSFQLGSDFFNAINFSAAYTDYEHIEIENGEPGTQFENDTTELRVEAIHSHWADWRGGFSLHYKNSDFSALGEEAFTPASETSTLGIGWIEERHFGDFLVQLGARLERVDIDVPELLMSEVELYEEDHDEHHDDEHHDDDHEAHHDEHEHAEAPQSLSESFTPLSLSAGIVWSFADGYNASMSYSRAERAPSTAELFSLGPHLGSGYYEIGAFYEIDDEDHVVARDMDFDVETSNNLDFSLRKYEGDFGFVFNLFYNQVDNYYFDANTGFFAEFAHEHGEEEHDEMHDEMHEEAHDEDHESHGEEGLPVLLFTNTDATLYGAEFQLNYKASEQLTLRTQADMVRARIDTASDTTEAPRTPPMRWSASAEYSRADFYMDLRLTHVFEQDKVANFEEPTDSYTLVDFNVSYYMPVDQHEVEFFLKGRNLTDEEARVHTSYLRNDAPLPGRSVMLGLRASF